MDKRPQLPREWVETLPASEMIYPESLVHRIKYHLWRVYGPYHPTVRDRFISLRLVKNYGRQPYLVGTVAPKYSIEEFVTHLVKNGYAYHRIAWNDEGEVVSLRLVKDFVFQYHVRVFEDREVRGHYEYTPEAYPLLHLMNIGQENRKDEFLRLFGDMVTPHTSDDRSDHRWELLPLKRYLWDRSERVRVTLAEHSRPSTDRR